MRPMAIYPIQYLRAVAALMVVFHHSLIQLPWIGRYYQTSIGAHGVDLFFVISGFVMVLTTHGKEVTRAEFMRRRIVRVVPLYWALTLFTVLCVIVAPSLFRTTSIEPWHVVQSLLFIPHLSPSFPKEMWPVMVPGWTLIYEMFFYACFALTLGRFWVLAVGFVGLFLFGLAMEPGNTLLGFFSRYLILEFVAGAILAKLWFAAGSPLPAWAKWRSPLWLTLGDASYSIYLTHLFSLGVLRIVWKRAPETEASAIGFFIVALILSSLIGYATYRLLELPLLARLNAKRAKASQPAALSARRITEV
jgi:exopolysaccharide production protein ExoZ